jgi:hypothetical protein
MTTLNDNLHVLLHDLKCNMLYLYHDENCLNECCREKLNINFIFNVTVTSLAVLKTIQKKPSKLSLLQAYRNMILVMLSIECYIILPSLLCAAASCAMIHRETISSAFEIHVLLNKGSSFTVCL